MIYHIAFVVFSLAATLWSVNVDISFSRMTSYFLLLLLLLSGCGYDVDKNDVKKIKAALEASSLITVALLLMFAQTVEGRLILNEIIVEDPNYICAYLFFGLAAAVQRTIGKVTLKVRILSIFELLLLLYAILMTGSRGGLISAIIVVGVAVVLDGDLTVKKVLAKIAIVGVVFFVFLLLFSNLPDDIKRRFTVENIESSGASGRFNLWENAISIFRDSDAFRKLFGYGPESLRDCYRNFGFNVVSVAHNVFIENLVELGILGVLTYVATIFSFSVNSFKIKDRFAFAVILGMIAMSMSTSISTFKPYYNIMLFILIALREKRTSVAVAAKKEEQ